MLEREQSIENEVKVQATVVGSTAAGTLEEQPA